MSGKMSGLFTSIARTFSDEVQVYKNSHPVRGRWLGANTDGADEQPQQQLRPIRTTHSLPGSSNAEPPLRHSSSTISESSETPVGSPTAVDTPVQAATAGSSPFTLRLKRGTHPYDYWYTIKNL
jgi:hypothetical protein